jgi:ATP-dependent helicase/nuclease subunit A
MALRILQGEGAWAWNPEALAWQGNEVELIHQGQLFRLDRLVQRKDTDNAGQWWVLDYKSADSPENQPDLIEKMRQYRSGVQGVYPGEEVRCAFLTGQGRLIEVD